jgi:hypothetical protein
MNSKSSSNIKKKGEGITQCLPKTIIPKGYEYKSFKMYAFVNEEDGSLWENFRGQQCIYSTEEECLEDSTFDMKQKGKIKEISVSYSYIKKSYETK